MHHHYDINNKSKAYRECMQGWVKEISYIISLNKFARHIQDDTVSRSYNFSQSDYKHDHSIAIV